MSTSTGSAGAHASLLRRQRALVGAVLLFVVFFALVAAVTAPPVLWLRAVLVATALVALVAADAKFKSASRAAVGARSERAVARVLDKVGADHLFHGKVIGRGGDADHVVLGRYVAVVETKTGRGPLRRDGDALFAGARRIPGDPVRQARAQATQLGRLSSPRCLVTAVVCVVDGVGVLSGDGWVVCGLKDLPAQLNTLPSVSPAASEALAEKLRAL